MIMTCRQLLRAMSSAAAGMLLLIAASPVAGQTNPVFTPSWNVGDVWEVDYTLSLPSKLKQPMPVETSRMDRARYEVIEKTDDGGQAVFVVRVSLRDGGQVLLL